MRNNIKVLFCCCCKSRVQLVGMASELVEAGEEKQKPFYAQTFCLSYRVYYYYCSSGCAIPCACVCVFVWVGMNKLVTFLHVYDT